MDYVNLGNYTTHFLKLNKYTTTTTPKLLTSQACFVMSYILDPNDGMNSTYLNTYILAIFKEVINGRYKYAMNSNT